MKQYTPTQKQVEQVENNFTYHPPTEGQPEKYTAIRNKYKELATLLIELCPESRELSMSLSELLLSNMLANASIACNEK